MTQVAGRTRYTDKFKTRVVSYVKQSGATNAEAANRFNVHSALVARWKKDPRYKPRRVTTGLPSVRDGGTAPVHLVASPEHDDANRKQLEILIKAVGGEVEVTIR